MTLILSHGPLKIELVGTFAVRVVFWFIPSLAFLILDMGIPSLSENIKIYGATSLPRRNAASLLRQILLAVVNLLLFSAVQAGLSLGSATLLKEPLFKTSTSLPLPWQMIKHIGWLYVSREIFTYYIHRNILHSRGTLASLHNKYGHCHRGAPYSLMLYADHPLPLMLHRLLPIYIPSLLIRPHLLTYFLFTVFTTVEEMLSMSGYSIVPGFIMGGVARRTATHYASGGEGNFGAWGILDWLNGTSVGKDVIADIQDEAEKHHLKERSQRKAIDTGGSIQDGIDHVRRSKRNGKKE